MKASKETKEKAKALGIKSWHVKGEEKLLAEIAELTTAREETPTQTVDSAEIVTVREVAEETNECPVDIETLKTSLRGLGGKSPYWEWRHLVNG